MHSDASNVEMDWLLTPRSDTRVTCEPEYRIFWNSVEFLLATITLTLAVAGKILMRGNNMFVVDVTTILPKFDIASDCQDITNGEFNIDETMLVQWIVDFVDLISEKTSLDRDTLKISVIGIYKIWAQLTKIHAGMSRPGRQQMLAHSEL
ncbi:hypothetical protein GQX74_009444 [Glossina fuscipes]|nr:hypothetical protein GQX74_009444 [Glossina fuscipes]